MKSLRTLAAVGLTCLYAGCMSTSPQFSNTEPLMDFTGDSVRDFLYWERGPNLDRAPWMLIMREGDAEGYGKEHIVARFAIPPAKVEIGDYNRDKCPDIFIYKEYDPSAYNGRGGTPDGTSALVLVNDGKGNFRIGNSPDGTLIERIRIR